MMRIIKAEVEVETGVQIETNQKPKILKITKLSKEALMMSNRIMLSNRKITAQILKTSPASSVFLFYDYLKRSSKGKVLFYYQNKERHFKMSKESSNSKTSIMKK